MIKIEILAIGLCASFSLAAGNVSAQEMKHVSYKTSQEHSTYEKQLNIDAGDIPKHIVRVFSLTRDHLDNPVVVNGVKIVKETARGITDIIDGNGTATFYLVFTGENGDKMYARMSQVSTGDGGKINATATGPITGGTGALEHVKGIVRNAVKFDVTSGFNEGSADIDYSVAK